MNRRTFLKFVPFSTLPLIAGCKYLRIDPDHFLIRSPIINSLEQEKEILSRAKLDWTPDGRIRVVYLKGTPYEMGYQQGALLRNEINENLGYIYEQAEKKFRFPEIFAEVYERMRPYIPQQYIDEMHGLAHGSRMPLHIIHYTHILPELGEWGGKKRIKKVIDQMMAGELATTCSNLSAGSKATVDGRMYAVRVLDWGMHKISKLHKYPSITIGCLPGSIPFANIGWMGFLGAVSGMNAKGITLGEMGYGDHDYETLSGIPMPFLLREIMSHASSLEDVRRIIQSYRGTNSFVYLMTDGKTDEAELYIRDPERFIVFKQNQEISDKSKTIPAIKDVVYGGHFNDKMTDQLSKYHGQVSPKLLMDKIIPEIAMKSNFQNVIYDPKGLRFWVSNASDKETWAASQPYTEFDLGNAFKNNGYF